MTVTYSPVSMPITNYAYYPTNTSGYPSIISLPSNEVGTLPTSISTTQSTTTQPTALPTPAPLSPATVESQSSDSDSTESQHISSNQTKVLKKKRKSNEKLSSRASDKKICSRDFSKEYIQQFIVDKQLKDIHLLTQLVNLPLKERTRQIVWTRAARDLLMEYTCPVPKHLVCSILKAPIPSRVARRSPFSQNALYNQWHKLHRDCLNLYEIYDRHTGKIKREGELKFPEKKSRKARVRPSAASKKIIPINAATLSSSSSSSSSQLSLPAAVVSEPFSDQELNSSFLSSTFIPNQSQWLSDEDFQRLMGEII